MSQPSSKLIFAVTVGILSQHYTASQSTRSRLENVPLFTVQALYSVLEIEKQLNFIMIVKYMVIYIFCFPLN